MDTQVIDNGFAQYLIASGLLQQAQAKAVLTSNFPHKDSFIFTLIQKNLIPNHQLTKCIAEYFKLPYLDLAEYHSTIQPKFTLAPPLVVQQYALPLFEQENTLHVAVIDPTISELNELIFLTEKKIQLVVVDAEKMCNFLDNMAYKDLNRNIEDIHSKDDSANSPVVFFLNRIINEAVKMRSSDIHFEPFELLYRIRFRIDGMLTTVAKPSIKMVDHITARLKIMCNLDISERRIPQDGRFKLKFGDLDSIDFRVNTCPTLHGEKIVLRVLESKKEFIDIKSLGFSEDQQLLFIKSIKRSQGMILATGPTGSGKTMTLYSALNYLNTVERNILTVEDPIEIELPGINQVHINVKKGLTFALALRAFLRQDPDIIMVGEIRDLETAEIAVKASQTGHLVLSTLHTNSAAETLARLVNMGIPAYNIANSISLIIAQRLVRRLCQYCKVKIDMPLSVLLEHGFFDDEISYLTLYGPNSMPCSKCHHGYHGRLAIFEVLPISEKMGRLIIEGCSTIDISKQAREEKIYDLQQSALDKVRLGLTSLSEINGIIEHHENKT